jgi:hypothetical protein
MEATLIISEEYSAESTANWLVERNISFRNWFNTQYKIIGMYMSDGQHDRARFFYERAAEISDYLRAMGAVHLLH